MDDAFSFTANGPLLILHTAICEITQYGNISVA